MQLTNLQNQEPQRYVYEMYIKKITYFGQNSPEANWDGVFNYESKLFLNTKVIDKKLICK
jgi:predicted RNA-binding protein with PUA-like domain